MKHLSGRKMPLYNKRTNEETSTVSVVNTYHMGTLSMCQGHPAWVTDNKMLALQKLFCSFFKWCHFGGAWVAQLVKCLTLNLGTGHDLTVCEFEPYIGL